MSRLILLTLFFTILTNCKSRESSEIFGTQTSDSSKYGIEKSDKYFFEIKMSEGKDKVWPYFVLRADFGVDVVSHRDYVNKELKKYEFARPVWLDDGYLAIKNHTVTGAELISLIDAVVAKEFGGKITDVKSIYLDIYNNNTSFSSVDSELFKGVEIQLPLEKIAGYYLFPSEKREEVNAKIKKNVTYSKVNFDLTVITTKQWEHKCSGNTDIFNSKKAEVFIRMNKPNELKDATLIFRGDYDVQLSYAGIEGESLKFISNFGGVKSNVVVLISNDFEKNGAKLLYSGNKAAEQVEVNLDACKKL